MEKKQLEIKNKILEKTDFDEVFDAVKLTVITGVITIPSRMRSQQVALSMKVAIITDTHYGARKNSKLFHDYFEKFYNEIFFPKLEEEGITTVIHMGDWLDSRKGVDFTGPRFRPKRVVFDPLKEKGITMLLMVVIMIVTTRTLTR